MRRLPLSARMIVMLMAVAPLLSGCQDGTLSGMVVFDGRHVVDHERTIRGDLAVIGGEVRIASGATIQGSVWLLGGTCSVDGTVEGDVNALAGALSVGDSAVIRGKLHQAGSLLDVAPDARIVGGIAESTPEGMAGRASVGSRLLGGARQALVVGVLGLLLGFWFARPIANTGRTAFRYPSVSLAVGLLAGVIGLIVSVLVGFTIILLPLAFLMALQGLLAAVYGWFGLGAAIARRLTPGFPPPLRIGLGSLGVAMSVSVVSLVPLVGGLLGLTMTAWGLGAALITRFGLRAFRPAVIPPADPDETG